MSRSRTAFALGLVVPLLVVGGCSGDEPRPRIAPSESPSPTTSPSPAGPVEPTMPAVAKQHTTQGAEAFVAYYWRMVNYAQTSGDLSGLESLGSKACQACIAGIAGLSKVFERGGRIHGGEATLSRFSSSEIRAGDHRAFQVAVDISNTRQVIAYPGDTGTDVYPPGSVSARFVVDPTAEGLVMAYWTKLS